MTVRKLIYITGGSIMGLVGGGLWIAFHHFWGGRLGSPSYTSVIIGDVIGGGLGGWLLEHVERVRARQRQNGKVPPT